MESRTGVVESLLRILSAVAAVATACVVGFNRQTKTIFFGYAKTATVKDLKALWILMIVASVSAGYHLLQLSRYMISAWLGKTSKECWSDVCDVCIDVRGDTSIVVGSHRRE
ncbi:hypothetical protein QJS04_geneDACA013877 [Acorus gramineus]|uniref:CASP-like protein n=1 Tax=Acorus gramineus TaxID=55184 RepID=A0AAV9AUF7_ACOGR|nr:hypothetical protein QJS04_geneDACA013877 [Acorus gramineus]